MQSNHRGIRAPLSIRVFFLGIALIASASVLVPLGVREDHNATNLRARLLVPGELHDGRRYVLGTDHLGRDFLFRLFYATRTTLVVSFGGMLLASSSGTLLGFVSGWAGGFVDTAVMFVVDALLAIPFTLIALVAAAILEPGSIVIILIFGLGGWAGFARLVRGQVLQVKEMTYIEGSRAVGSSSGRVLFEHVLPNISSALIVHATLSISGFILSESAISFLGLGIQPPEISLGLMVSGGRDYLIQQWWLSLVPSFVIVAIVLQFSLIGDWLRDVLDPRLLTR
jgi:peptide/nickel transport system permease protein